MPTLALLDLLAQLPESTIYVSVWKLAAATVLFTLWVLFAQWVNTDTVAVNTFQTIWNTAVMLCGTVAAVLLFFLPEFVFGLAAFVLINGVFMMAYVIHRNGLVVEGDKVGTPTHIKRVMREGFKGSKKKDKLDVKERVRITGADGSVIGIPEADSEREQFALAQDLLFDALWRRANHVEVSPAGQASKVRVEVDGVGSDREALTRPQGDAVLAFFKKSAGLNLEERRKPQKGQIMAALGGEHKFDVVVRTKGSTAGEKLSLRVIGDEKDYKIADIGLTDDQLSTVRELMDAEHGIVLVSAPPGGGLTTTIYSLTRSNDAFLQNIQTVEYEKELDINNITQHVYEQSDDRPFTDELQRVIRTDPDVIVLPEVRERGVGPIVSASGSQKQVVYVALTARDLLDALRKWAAMVGNAKLIAASLLAVTHQRLVRVLCPSCKTPYKPDPATLKKINMPADKVLYRPSEPQYDKRGDEIVCQNCHGAGYVGRTGVFNMLVFDDDLRKVVASGGSLADIKTAAARKGGFSLQQQALQKVLDGVTSIEEVVRVTRPAKPAAGGASAKPRADKPSAA